MSLLRIKNVDGTWAHIPAIAGKDGKDGAIQYTAGNGIEITEDNVINCTFKVSEAVDEALNQVANDLKNYYTKSETYNRDEINSLIDSIKTSTIEVVATRPEVGEENVIYLVPKDEKTENIYYEWMYINKKWELIGTTEVDLSNYYTKTEIDTILGSLDNLETADKGSLVNAINNVYNNAGVPVLTDEVVNTYSLDGGIYKLNGTKTVNFLSSKSYAISRPQDTNILIVINCSGTTDNVLLFVRNKIVEFRGETIAEYSLYDFANRSEVITKTNTTSYVPTSTYNPATKGYVDDAIANAELGGGSGTTFTEEDPLFTASAASTITSNDITNWNNKANANEVLTRDNVSVYEPVNTYNPATKGYVDSEVAKALGVDLSGYYTKEEVNQAIAAKAEEDPVFKASPAHQITNENISEWNSKLTANEVLTKTNTSVYVPTDTYHPATKDYIDNSIRSVTASIRPTITFTGTDSLMGTPNDARDAFINMVNTHSVEIATSLKQHLDTGIVVCLICDESIFEFPLFPSVFPTTTMATIHKTHVDTSRMYSALNVRFYDSSGTSISSSGYTYADINSVVISVPSYILDGETVTEPVLFPAYSEYYDTKYEVDAKINTAVNKNRKYKELEVHATNPTTASGTNTVKDFAFKVCFNDAVVRFIGVVYLDADTYLLKDLNNIVLASDIYSEEKVTIINDSGEQEEIDILTALNESISIDITSSSMASCYTILPCTTNAGDIAFCRITIGNHTDGSPAGSLYIKSNPDSDTMGTIVRTIGIDVTVPNPYQIVWE